MVTSGSASNAADTGSDDAVTDQLGLGVEGCVVRWVLDRLAVPERARWSDAQAQPSPTVRPHRGHSVHLPPRPRPISPRRASDRNARCYSCLELSLFAPWSRARRARRSVVAQVGVCSWPRPRSRVVSRARLLLEHPLMPADRMIRRVRFFGARCRPVGGDGSLDCSVRVVVLWEVVIRWWWCRLSDDSSRGGVRCE